MNFFETKLVRWFHSSMFMPMHALATITSSSDRYMLVPELRSKPIFPKSPARQPNGNSDETRSSKQRQSTQF